VEAGRDGIVAGSGGKAASGTLSCKRDDDYDDVNTDDADDDNDETTLKATMPRGVTATRLPTCTRRLACR